jgi:hypothetical protein
MTKLDIPQEILDLAVRRALDGSKGKLVVCPFCGGNVTIAIFACNSCWLKLQDDFITKINDHVAERKSKRALMKKLLGKNK